MSNVDEFPTLDAQQEAFADKLLAVFEKQDDQGEFVYKDQDVRLILPALLMGSGLTPSEFKYGPIKGLFAEFRQKLKLKEDVSDDDFLIASRRYYRKNPPDKALMAALKEHLN